MPRSWVNLIIIAMAILVFLTGIEIYQAITGGEEPRQFKVDGIDASLDKGTFKFIENNKDKIKVRQEEI